MANTSVDAASTRRADHCVRVCECVRVLVVVLMADSDQERVRPAHLLHKEQSEVFQSASSPQAGLLCVLSSTY